MQAGNAMSGVTNKLGPNSSLIHCSAFRVNETTQAYGCKLLQEVIIHAIEGCAVPTFDTAFNVYPKNNRYVAMFGDSEVNRTGDWVEILYKNRPVPPQVCIAKQFMSQTTHHV